MRVFVTGTDTGVGKTVVTALLARVWADEGRRVRLQKWVSTGCQGESEDVAFILRTAGLDTGRGEKGLISPYCFTLPASPHLAAEAEGRRVDEETLRVAYSQQAAQAEVLLVEGVGGLLVPLNRQMLLADFVSELRLPALLVARSGLGTLNHTLLSLEALRHRDIPVLGVLLNSLGGEDPRLVEDNRRTLAEFGRVEVWGPLPHVKDPQDAVAAMRPVARRLWQRWEEMNRDLAQNGRAKSEV